jgi:signal transduction histidine kinase
LDNAEQHADGASPVDARLWRDRQGLHFEVRNCGPAVSAARLAGMWQRFYTTRSEDGGSGLGLAIVKSAVEAHGGRVVAQSQGHDMRVGFVLPG